MQQEQNASTTPEGQFFEVLPNHPPSLFRNIVPTSSEGYGTLNLKPQGTPSYNWNHSVLSGEGKEGYLAVDPTALYVQCYPLAAPAYGIPVDEQPWGYGPPIVSPGLESTSEAKGKDVATGDAIKPYGDHDVSTGLFVPFKAHELAKDAAQKLIPKVSVHPKQSMLNWLHQGKKQAQAVSTTADSIKKLGVQSVPKTILTPSKVQDQPQTRMPMAPAVFTRTARQRYGSKNPPKSAYHFTA